MIQKGVFICQIIKHIYLSTQEMSVDFVDPCIATLLYILSYSRKYFLNSLKFMPLPKVLLRETLESLKMRTWVKTQST